MENIDFKKYENKSNFRIGVIITFYHFLKFLNSKKFYFIFSLTVVLLFCFVLNFSLSLGLFCHFLIWVIFNKKLINENELKNENNEIDFIILRLKEIRHKKKV